MSTAECFLKEESPNLIKLRQLTPMLRSWHPLKKNGHVVEADVKEGYSVLFGLLKQDEIAVCRVFDSTDTRYERHSHSEDEIFVVYKGAMRVIFDEREEVLQAGDFLHIPKNIPHATHTLANCRYIAITMPAAEIFPRGLNDNEPT